MRDSQRRRLAREAHYLKAEDPERSLREIAGALGVSKSAVDRWLKAPPPEDRSPVPNHATRGEQRGLTHGARSDRLVKPRADRLAPAILRANSHLDVTRDGPAVRRYALILSRMERVHAWLFEQADPVFASAEDGEIHAVYERLERWEAAAERAEKNLALSPLTRAKLGLLVGERTIPSMGRAMQRAAIEGTAEEIDR